MAGSKGHGSSSSRNLELAVELVVLAASVEARLVVVVSLATNLEHPVLVLPALAITSSKSMMVRMGATDTKLKNVQCVDYQNGCLKRLRPALTAQYLLRVRRLPMAIFLPSPKMVSK